MPASRIGSSFATLYAMLLIKTLEKRTHHFQYQCGDGVAIQLETSSVQEA
jgi:hypothetical protein